MALKVFLSYAREDGRVVEGFYDRLEAEGFEPWMDVRKLLPGQNWEVEIDRALREANVVIAWLSSRSVNKRGFVQREANFALDSLKYKLPTDIYFVPVLLEACDVPTHLAVRQYINIQTPNAWEQIIASLKLAASQQSIAIEKGISFGPYNVAMNSISEHRDGHPGHTIEIEHPQFSSVAKPEAAAALTTLFEDRAKAQLVANRSDPADQDLELFPVAGEFRSNNGYWESVQLAYSSESIVSIVLGTSTYGAGAAHPNHGVEAFNFTTIDGLRRFSLNDLFVDPYAAEQELSSLCIDRIAREYWRRTGEAPDEGAAAWITEGCKPHEGNFHNFVVMADGIAISFTPYQVAPYALGAWEIELSYYDLLPYLDQEGPYGHIRKQRG